jgi:quercetin dioxygenase-like cupin family protein
MAGHGSALTGRHVGYAPESSLAAGAPRSRTFWHRHQGGQMLLGCAGRGLVVTRDAVHGIGESAVVHAFAGEDHWHGMTV